MPAARSRRSGTSAAEAKTPRRTFEAGQTSSVVPAAASRSSRTGSSTARTPWPTRSAPSRSRQVRTLSAPLSSPPCGTDSRPARVAIRKAGSNSSVRPRRSSLDRPKPTTPRPACIAASRARVRASSGCRVRLAAMTTATPVPVASVASRAASSTTSTAGVSPPRYGAYDVGSTWISSQPDPSRASSSAASCTSRRTSASPRTTERAVS